jgi:hypothetical protein
MNKKLNKENVEPIFIKGKKAQAFSTPYLLFFQFTCPHCQEHNVIGKSQKQEYLLCSNSVCRKVIILENYKDIA